jgi:hypothetical protein
MSKVLSGTEVGAREAEGERDGKTLLANAENCAFLTLAIPVNFAQLSPRSTPFPINLVPLPAKESPGARNTTSPKIRGKTDSAAAIPTEKIERLGGSPNATPNILAGFFFTCHPERAPQRFSFVAVARRGICF